MGKVRMGASVSWCHVVFVCAVFVFGIDIQRGSAEVSEPSTVVEGNQETPEQEVSKGSTSETGSVTSSSDEEVAVEDAKLEQTDEVVVSAIRARQPVNHAL